MAQPGRFTGFEALNFADAQGNVLEIRDSIGGPYGSVSARRILPMMQKVGVVTVSHVRRTQ